MKGMNLHSVGQFPAYRPRRLRQSAALRRLGCETQLSAAQLVLPLFVRAGRKVRRPIEAMPGAFRGAAGPSVGRSPIAGRSGRRAAGGVARRRA